MCGRRIDSTFVTLESTSCALYFLGYWRRGAQLHNFGWTNPPQLQKFSRNRVANLMSAFEWKSARVYNHRYCLCCKKSGHLVVEVHIAQVCRQGRFLACLTVFLTNCRSYHTRIAYNSICALARDHGLEFLRWTFVDNVRNNKVATNIDIFVWQILERDFSRWGYPASIPTKTTGKVCIARVIWGRKNGLFCLKGYFWGVLSEMPYLQSHYFAQQKVDLARSGKYSSSSSSAEQNANRYNKNGRMC